MSLLIAPDAERGEHELDLRQRGYVPITSYEAGMSRLHWLLPECQVKQLVPDRNHGRVVWAHPGPSGVDPRAVAALAIVRVADGLGDPLDEPMTLLEASRWLLTGDDVERWLTRARHRVLVGQPGVACLFERDRLDSRCLTHAGYDPELQGVATALGDESFRGCSALVLPRTPRSAWTGASCSPLQTDFTTLVRSALSVTLRLAGWYRHGVRGSLAWDLARRGVSQSGLVEWLKAGFTLEEVAQWAFHGDVDTCRQYRDLGAVPVGPLTLPPVPQPLSTRERGLHWFVQLGMARHGQKAQIKPCPRCGASDTIVPCRTCQREDNRLDADAPEWTAFEGLALLDRAYGADDPFGHVPCGDRNCPTGLAGSAAVVEGDAQ